METVGFRCPVGFKNYPADMTVGTGTITSKGGRGATTPSTVLEATSMEESDPSENERVAQSINYSAVGKELLRGKLEELGGRAFVELQRAGRSVDEDGLSQAELSELHGLHTDLGHVLDLVEEARDGGVPEE